MRSERRAQPELDAGWQHRTVVQHSRVDHFCGSGGKRIVQAPPGIARLGRLELRPSRASGPWPCRGVRALVMTSLHCAASVASHRSVQRREVSRIILLKSFVQARLCLCTRLGVGKIVGRGVRPPGAQHLASGARVQEDRRLNRFRVSVAQPSAGCVHAPCPRSAHCARVRKGVSGAPARPPPCGRAPPCPIQAP